MEGSRLWWKFPIIFKLAGAQYRIQSVLPITSCAEVKAWRTSALTIIIEAFLSAINPPHALVILQKYTRDTVRLCA